MWGMVLALALLAAVDPVRIGTVVYLFSRPRPVRHLLALLLGGMVVCVVLGVGVLFGLHDLALGVMHGVELATTSSAAGRIQIVVGMLALVLAASMMAGFSARVGTPKAVRPGPESFVATSGATALSRVSRRAVGAVQSGPPWITFLVGMVLTTDFRYLAVLTAILASGAAAGAQAGAAALYTVLSLAFAEIPLASQLVAPARTRAAMSRVHDWVRARRREVLGVIVAVLGVFLTASGMGYV